MRNLLSNALKFTFRGGNIQVDAAFVPGVRVSLPMTNETSRPMSEWRRQVMSVVHTVLHQLFGVEPTEGSLVIHQHINTHQHSNTPTPIPLFSCFYPPFLTIITYCTLGFQALLLTLKRAHLNRSSLSKETIRLLDIVGIPLRGTSTGCYVSSLPTMVLVSVPSIRPDYFMR